MKSKTNPNRPFLHEGKLWKYEFNCINCGTLFYCNDKDVKLCHGTECMRRYWREKKRNSAKRFQYYKQSALYCDKHGLLFNSPRHFMMKCNTEPTYHKAGTIKKKKAG